MATTPMVVVPALLMSETFLLRSVAPRLLCW